MVRVKLAGEGDKSAAVNPARVEAVEPDGENVTRLRLSSGHSLLCAGSVEDVEKSLGKKK